ncbi:MAG: helix-turn-helix transcriptional regulator [Nitrospiraceae bacterium]|jgi:AraC-like DNA-binding protein|nr:helix-turn-helix transcriptional regulator [Nitrospiraceae bacterium]
MISVGLLPQPEELAQEKSQAFEKQAENAIRTMRRFLRNPPSIPELAEEARITPWHFIRQFRRAVGIPPGEYLAALRIEFAKTLLLKTPEKVTNICFDLGFSSLGSFTSRFSSLVCVSPVAFRRLVDGFTPKDLEIRIDRQEKWRKYPGLRGTVRAPSSFSGPVFVGLFPKSIPERWPVAGTLLMGPGAFHIPGGAPEGFLMAAGISSFHDPSSYLIPGDDLLVGVLPLADMSDPDRIELSLRSPGPLDPPLLVALLACLGRPDPVPSM